ncbi:hypothetical protein PoB_001659900 [Plakobranchus ocellatus]|uniref:Uncharacterized protein n=1 Tax=Plakobranchus ocellatus TaxID=259542 RepID=A0AAV3Z6T1_9GAST|nr:hypothetical protein PoB_001659900 [Plakobranchus ocellatus]
MVLNIEEGRDFITNPYNVQRHGGSRAFADGALTRIYETSYSAIAGTLSKAQTQFAEHFRISPKSFNITTKGREKCWRQKQH